MRTDIHKPSSIIPENYNFVTIRCREDEELGGAALNILFKGYSDLTGLSIKNSSAELVDYKRGEDVRLGDMIDRHLATSVKRLDKFIDLS